MEFRNQTTYDKKALTAMNRIHGKTLGRTRTMVVRSLCLLIGLVGLISGIYIGSTKGTSLFVSLSMAYGLLFLAIAVFWYSVMAKSSQLSVTAGQNTNVSHFREDGFTEVPQNWPTSYHYEDLCEIAEDSQYFVLFLDKTHSVIISKSQDSASFAPFLEEKTGLQLKKT